MPPSSLRPRLAALTGALLALLLTACGGGGSTSTPAPTAGHSSHPTTTPTPTPTPDPATEKLQVIKAGVGDFDLVVMPTAIVKNLSPTEAALAVKATFTPSGGYKHSSLSSSAVNIPPGATVVLSADCTDGCNQATSTSVTLAVGSWGGTTQAPTIAVSGVSYACGNCTSSEGYGTVTATLTNATIPTEEPVYLFAACMNAAGTIIGGGPVQIYWSKQGSPQTAQVPVIVSHPPASCQVSALIGA